MIEEQRTEYRRLRGQLDPQARKLWEKFELEKKGETPPLTPTQWLDTLQEFLSETRFIFAEARWKNLRLSDEQFFGEDPDPSKDVDGYRDDLPIETKITLINRQFNEDLQYLTSYEDWEASRD